ncbi:MAG: polymerase, sigma-24 subunit, RpoE [Verrucomicrobiales bacterium]|nr:polymerase, sigma-24 subunit, RpoE [Verrucomicrobiales bacterium]
MNAETMSTPIELLCELAKKGDSQAAAELVTLFYRRAFAYFRRLCGDDTEAADLTQKTFLKVWTALPSYEGHASFNTWLHAIAHHVYVDWRRKPGRNDARSDEWWEIQPDAGPAPCESAEERDLGCRVYSFVEKLDEGTRETVHLHYYQGLSLRETAATLGIAVSTVKYRLRSALDFLRPRLVETSTFTRR